MGKDIIIIQISQLNDVRHMTCGSGAGGAGTIISPDTDVLSWLPTKAGRFHKFVIVSGDRT